MQNNIELYAEIDGKRFKVRKLAKTTDEANDFLATRPDTGVIAEEDGIAIIADIQEAQ